MHSYLTYNFNSICFCLIINKTFETTYFIHLMFSHGSYIKLHKVIQNCIVINTVFIQKSFFHSGLFRNTIIHSGAPISHWFLSTCIQTSRESKTPENCQPATSLITTEKQKVSNKLFKKFQLRSRVSTDNIGKETTCYVTIL